MNVEIVHNEMPASAWVRGNHVVHMRQKVGFRAPGSAGGSQDLAAGDLPTENERTRPMPQIFKLTAFDFAGGQGQSRMQPFERLHPSQFIGTHHFDALLCQLGSSLVQRTNRLDFRVELFVLGGGQPIADTVRLQIPFLSNRAAWRGEICATMPRCMISSASSRAVQWLMGRSLGCSHARATIWQICSAVMRAGVPGRGSSANRSAADRSVNATACNRRHRIRQRRTTSASVPSAWAISVLFWPAAAARIIRARLATCWPVRCPRTNRSNSARSSSLKVSGAGFGPRMGDPFPSGFLPFYQIISAMLY